MAHQLIFTSSVRGIKPGASGYCTVLRSPGIRPSIERALEGLSVFEHIARNVNGSVQSLRHIELRGVTYYVLSRVSDAGKDYTGRTNFLAHYLVFEVNELPTVSPVDLLLNWSGWCHAWSGEPREEAVDASSFSTVARLQPPATLWQQQPCGVSPAVTLATGADVKTLIQSVSLPPSELLQLIGESFAVRAKLLRDNTSSWRTSFSVGLASDSHARDFTWIGTYWQAEAALLRSREFVDVALPLHEALTVDAKALAIAETGRYVAPPKPIQLTQDPAMRGVVEQALEEVRDAPSFQPNNKRYSATGRKRSPQSNVGKSKKTRSKLPIYVGLCVVLIVAVGVWSVWMDKQEKSDYLAAVEDMVKLVEGDSVTQEAAQGMLIKLAQCDPETVKPDQPAIELNRDLLDDVKKYIDAFSVLNELAKPREVTGPDWIDKLMDSTSESVQQPIEAVSVNMPKIECIFDLPGLVVFLTQVGEPFPIKPNQLEGIRISIMHDFSLKSPLARTDFGEPASYHKLKDVLKESASEVTLVREGHSLDAAKSTALLIEPINKDLERMLVLVYGDVTDTLELDYNLASAQSCKDTYDHFYEAFNLDGLDGASELRLYQGQERYDKVPEVRAGERRFDGNQAVEEALGKYEIHPEDVSISVILAEMASEVGDILDDQIKRLKQDSSDDVDNSLAMEKIGELKAALKQPDLVKKISGEIEALRAGVSPSGLDAMSGPAKRKRENAELELGDLPRLISSAMKNKSKFALSYGLDEVSFKKNSKWSDRTWKVFSDETRKYEDHYTKKGERAKQEEEFRSYQENAVEFTTLEIYSEGRQLAKINLKYQK